MRISSDRHLLPRLLSIYSIDVPIVKTTCYESGQIASCVYENILPTNIKLHQITCSK